MSDNTFFIVENLNHNNYILHSIDIEYQSSINIRSLQGFVNRIDKRAGQRRNRQENDFFVKFRSVSEDHLISYGVGIPGIACNDLQHHSHNSAADFYEWIGYDKQLKTVAHIDLFIGKK